MSARSQAVVLGCSWQVVRLWHFEWFRRLLFIDGSDFVPTVPTVPGFLHFNFIFLRLSTHDWEEEKRYKKKKKYNNLGTVGTTGTTSTIS